MKYLKDYLMFLRSFEAMQANGSIPYRQRKQRRRINREYEKFLSDLSTEQRNFLENYMDIVDHAHFQEQQRAYYQGIVDAVQILAGLGIVKESVKVKELLNTIMK